MPASNIVCIPSGTAAAQEYLQLAVSTHCSGSTLQKAHERTLSRWRQAAVAKHFST